MRSATRPLRWPRGIKQTDPIETAEMWTKSRISMPEHFGRERVPAIETAQRQGGGSCPRKQPDGSLLMASQAARYNRKRRTANDVRSSPLLLCRRSKVNAV